MKKKPLVKILISIIIIAFFSAAGYYLYTRGLRLPFSGGDSGAPRGALKDVEGENAVIAVLYFGSPDGSFIKSEERKLPKKEIRLKQMEAVLEELVKGPADSAKTRVIAEGTELRSVFFEDGIFYADFNETFVSGHIGGSTGELLTITSIANTLIENFPDIKGVEFLVEGKNIDTLKGHIDLTSPVGFTRDIISTEEVQGDENGGF